MGEGCRRVAGGPARRVLNVTDTAGKTNKVDDTRKEITLSDENIQTQVKDTLDAMFAAYNAENLQKLMGYVGEDFAGDKGILERAAAPARDAVANRRLMDPNPCEVTEPDAVRIYQTVLGVK